MTELPEHWASAKDPEGITYYYHTVTRETTWDVPKLTDSDLKEKEQKLKRQLEKYIAELLLSYRDPHAQKECITKSTTSEQRNHTPQPPYTYVHYIFDYSNLNQLRMGKKKRLNSRQQRKFGNGNKRQQSNTTSRTYKSSTDASRLGLIDIYQIKEHELTEL